MKGGHGVIKNIPPHMMPVEEEVLASMRAFHEEAKRYDAALDRYLAALSKGKGELLVSATSQATEANAFEYYNGSIAGARRHREMLKHFLDDFAGRS